MLPPFSIPSPGFFTTEQLVMNQALLAQKHANHLHLHAKLACLGRCLLQRFVMSIHIYQTWLACRAPSSTQPATSPPSIEDVQFVADPALGLAGDTDFNSFRETSCQTTMRPKDGLPGRVWSTGAVQVVQSLRIIPLSLHPMCRLGEKEMSKLAELLYIPIFDGAAPSKHPAAVLEIFLSSRSPEPMLMADLISFVEAAAGTMGLSVSSPLPQPICSSSLRGRRLRLPDSAEDMQQGAKGDAAAGSASCWGQTHKKGKADYCEMQ